MHCYLNVAAPNMRRGITLLHVMSGVGSMLVAMQGAAWSPNTRRVGVSIILVRDT